LEHIEELSKLERLNLEKTHITDAGLGRLKGMTNLIYLNLDRTQITDAGLGPVQ
jgi:hypothetical protein